MLGFSIFGLLVIYGCIVVFFRSAINKKSFRQYRHETPLIKRLLLISMQSYVKNKYSKREHATIRYPAILKWYCMIFHLLFALFLMECMLVLLFLFQLVGQQYVNTIFAVFVAACFTFLCSFAVVELITNKKYHRSRYRK